MPKQEQEPASDEIVEVAPGVLRLQLPVNFPGLGHVNTYALEDGEGVALVDPGLPGEASWLALQERLADAGIPLARVHTVIVTHSHPDHFGGAGLLAEETGARLVASTWFRTLWDPDDGEVLADGGEDAEDVAGGAPGAGPRLDGHDGAQGARVDDGSPGATRLDPDTFRAAFGRPTPWGGRTDDIPAERRADFERDRAEMLRWFRLPRPTHRLDDADRIVLARRDWVALFTPGHTNDHLCLFDPEGGVLLAGDHVLPTITPHISGMVEGDSLDRYMSSLDRVAALEGVTVALPAHGHPFHDLPGRVTEIKRHHEERLDRLRAISAELGWASVTDVSHQLFAPRSWGSMAESETYAHLEHLRHRGQAEVDERDGLLYYLVP
jgi:glyoxylase-like metal-dependent hydrolase (beta-lactamase superfamily II)